MTTINFYGFLYFAGVAMCYLMALVGFTKWYVESALGRDRIPLVTVLSAAFAPAWPLLMVAIFIGNVTVLAKAKKLKKENNHG